MNVYYLDERICMDCEKSFIPTIKDGTRKPYKCWYWGKLNPCTKYKYFLKLTSKEPKGWQKALMKIIPDYYPPGLEPTVNPITARWLLRLKELWVIITDPEYRKLSNLEMWTCHECVAKEKERVKNE